MTAAVDTTASSSRRVLAVADPWEGSNGYAYVKAFRRLGHSVRVVPVDGYIPSEWRARPLRALRRMLAPLLVREYNAALKNAAAELRPHLFFVFKGRNVLPETIDAIRSGGAVAVNVYPDVSFLAHGPYLPRALPRYDWVFQTKRFGIADMQRHLGIRRLSFLPHGFDPDVHRPVPLSASDLDLYRCDVSFIGTWSPKKQRLIEHICRRLPGLHVRVWGAQWEVARGTLGQRIQGRGVHGTEYVKAIRASRINLAILSEAREGASAGDQTTSRTFHIPASGGFMLHERTGEFLEYFEEGADCACFETSSELIEKIGYYLDRDDERQRLGAAGRRRALTSGYSVDCRAKAVLADVVGLRRAASA